MVLEKTLRVSWTTRIYNLSIIKEICTECSLEGLMSKLKLQYFGHLMGRADPFEKTLMLGKIEGRRRRGRQRMRWLDGITDSMKLSFGRLWVGDGQGGLACCSPWSCKGLDTTELNRTVVTSFLMSSCLKNFIPRITQFLCDELLHLQIFKFYLEFPRWLHVKEFACNAGDTSSTPGSEKYPAEGNGNLP